MKRSEYKPLIDLSVLPRIQSKRNNGKVDWSSVVGTTLPFVCGQTSGSIIFLEQDGYKMLLKRVINGSSNVKECWITKSALLNSNLSRNLFNEIAFTCPELLDLFVDKEDAYRFTKTSHNTSLFRCPVCGHIKVYTMAAINSLGFKCDKCSDTSFKYPNKFMANILAQAGYEYQTEVTKTTEGFEWLENYRYDFLVIRENKKYFIEMDGYFHYNNNKMNGRTAQEQQEIDCYKDKLAYKHGCHVVRINCCYKSILSRFDAIKHNVINSGVLNILQINEDDIDWEECDRQAMSNIFYEICNCWNSGIVDTNEIAKIIGVSWSCVYSNLVKGTLIGLCDYDSDLTKKNKINKAQREHGTPIMVLQDNQCIAVFPTIRELARQSLELFGVSFNVGSISYASRGVCQTCYGYQIKKVTHEEYEQLAPQFNQTIQN